MEVASRNEEELIHEGVQSLGHGRAADARAIFERLTAAGSASPLTWLLLAISCRHTRDAVAEETALDRLLGLDPHSLHGLIMKGDCRALAGATADAIRFYRASLAVADSTAVPPDMAGEVERARTALKGLEDRAYQKREALMVSRGMPREDWSPRFARALEIAAGRRTPYFQQPTVFTYPELPHIQYYDPADFDWAPAVEGRTADIRAEIVALLDARGVDDFRPYIQAQDGAVRLDRNKELVDSREWSALFLCENGKPDEALIERCPKTWETLQKVPLSRINGWGPTVMFSLLRGGARIAAHTGMFNTRLVCHLPLIVPAGCHFRVGNEVREWREGKLFIFDDTIEHEAWNDSGEDRVVLIFDIWRPELSQKERTEITALLAHQ